jgi:hypothetical protein
MNLYQTEDPGRLPRFMHIWAKKSFSSRLNAPTFVQLANSSRPPALPSINPLSSSHARLLRHYSLGIQLMKRVSHYYKKQIPDCSQQLLEEYQTHERQLISTRATEVIHSNQKKRCEGKRQPVFSFETRLGYPGKYIGYGPLVSFVSSAFGSVWARELEVWKDYSKEFEK